jgi:hypothetical protein
MTSNVHPLDSVCQILIVPRSRIVRNAERSVGSCQWADDARRWLLLPYAQSSVTHSRDSPTPIFQVRPTNVRVLTNVTPSTATPNFRFLFHNSTSSDYVCLIVCGCGCTYAGGRTENQILGGLCTMWQTATLQWMGCASMYDSCLI